jgi:hypothetical protein
VLAPLGLRLAPEKTRVVHIDEGFTFLGFDIRRLVNGYRATDRRPGINVRHASAARHG